MGKKYGPLPLWAWGLVGGVVLYLAYRYYQNSSGSSSTASTTGILDPNAVDPNTGLTYGEEEAAALNANAASIGGNGGGSSSPTESTAQSTVPSLSQELSDFQTFASTFESLQQTLNPSSVSPTATSPTTQAAAASPPIQQAPPIINNYISTSPAQVQTPSSPPPQSPPAVQRMSTGALRAIGAILAPFGATKPAAPPGYTTLGTGSGNWQFIPIKASAPPKTTSGKTGTPFGGFRP